jgi:hypothetical protein
LRVSRLVYPEYKLAAESIGHSGSIETHVSLHVTLGIAPFHPQLIALAFASRATFRPLTQTSAASVFGARALRVNERERAQHHD